MGRLPARDTESCIEVINASPVFHRSAVRKDSDFRADGRSCGIDETVTPNDTGHRYEHDYSICHSDRHMDDFGIELSAPAPAWDETALPCGTRWYGGT